MNIAIKRLNRPIELYGHWLLRFRWPVVFLSLILVLATAYGVRFLGFETDYRVFFSEDNPQLKAFEAFEATYTKDNNVLFVLEPKDGDVFTSSFLEAVETLTRMSWQIPHAIRVDSITNFQHTRADGNDLIVENLIENALALSKEELHEKKKIALAEPMLKGRLLAPDARVTAINVTLQAPESKPDTVFKISSFAYDLAEQIEDAHPDVRVHLTGIAILNNSFQTSGIHDMKTLVPIMYLIVFITVILLLHSPSATIATIFIVSMSVATGMGLAGWLGFQLTPPSSSAPTMIMTLAIADSIHILSNIFTVMQRGTEKSRAIVESLRLNMVPVFLTSLTTAIGFLSMNLSDAPPFRDLGNIVAMGVTAAFVYSVSFMPALVMILPMRPKKSIELISGRLNNFAAFVINHSRPLLRILILIVVLLSVFIFHNELNDEYAKYFSKKTRFRQDTDFTTNNLAGIYTIEHSVNAGESGGINNPEYLRMLEVFANWYRTQPGVVHVNTYADTIKRLNKNMHEDDPRWHRVPRNRDLAAQYLLLYEFSLPYGLDLKNNISLDKSATRLTVTMGKITANDLMRVAASAEKWLRKNAPEYMHGHGVGTSLTFAYISERNIKAMLWAAALAFAIIGFLLIFVFGSVKFGLLSMVPNLVPAIMAFGIWGIFVREINIGLAIVIGMTMGIVVDDTIHFMVKYMRARGEMSLSPKEAVNYTFATVGPAIFITSLVLIAGFLVLTFSNFALNSGMGKLSAITIACALVTDFLLLPPLLIHTDSIKHSESKK